MKEVIKLGPVEETLLIPLYMRAKETKRVDAIIKDELACEIVKRIEYDFSKFDKAWKSELGCIVRANHFDNKAREFIHSEANPVIVNVGCGLDTRYQRIKERDSAIFYELDFPEVIDLRKRLIPETKNDISIPSSMLETKWMDDLKLKHPRGNFLFIIEGVLMYLSENDIRSFLGNLAVRFHGAEVRLDVCGSMFLKRGVKNDSVKRTDAQFASAIDDGRIINKWIPNMVMIEDLDYFKLNKKRWGILGFCMRPFPSLSRRFSRILGFHIR